MRKNKITKEIITAFVILTMVTVTSCGSSSSSASSEVSSDDGSSASQEEVTVSRDGYSISTSDDYATSVGADVLENGGNAVDAAIAVSYALGTVEPYASGIGGGGGMLIYDPSEDKFTFLDYYSMAAPSGATGSDISVPGFVSGMQKAYDLYATKDFDELLSYSIDLAENGFVVSSDLTYAISPYSSYFSDSMPFNYVSEGETLIQSDLAETLKTIVSEGSESFYTGTIASEITAATDLTLDDLASYETYVEDGVTTEVEGYTIASAPAPFSGLTLLQIVKLMELMETPDPDDDPAAYLSDFVTAKMTTKSFRYNNITDFNFAGGSLDYDEYLTSDFLGSLVDQEFTETDSENESKDTTHISIIDQNGMIVSVTNTLSDFWGSGRSVSGFFLGNNLANFSKKGINAYEAGKRPRTFVAPAIVINEEGYEMAIGTPGGNLIPNITATVLTDIILYGTEPQEAVNKQRFIVEDYDTLLVETTLGTDPVVDYSGLGYNLEYASDGRVFGDINIAGYDPESGYFATSDPRRLGAGQTKN